MKRIFGLQVPRLRYSQDTAEIEELPVSKHIVLLWRDRSATDVVPEPGTQIKTGQNLSRRRTDAFVSPVTGRVASVQNFQGHDGKDYVAIEVSAQADDDYDPSLTVYDEFLDIDPGELLSVIFFMGFTEFAPLLRDPSGRKKPKTLIVSALDRDPLSIVNQQVLREHQADVERCISLVRHATQAEKTILAIPTPMASTIPAAAGYEGVERILVPPVYPNGLPELLAAHYGSGPLIQMSHDTVVGDTLVIDLEKAVEMLNCVESGKPLTHKRLTFFDSDNGQRKNVKVRIGTPIKHILAHMEKLVRADGKLVMDGFLKGQTCFSSEQPVTASSESIAIQHYRDVFQFEPAACINCGSCTAICPIGLQVHLIGRYAEYGFFDKCDDLGVAQCVECGLCGYICPSKRSLVQLIVRAKRGLGEPKNGDPSLEEALACNACGPSCPAVRLFDTEATKTPEEAP